MRTRTVPDFPPVHPGEVLLEDIHAPLALSQFTLAKAPGVAPIRVNSDAR